MNIVDLIISASISGVIGAFTGIVFSIMWRRMTYLRPARKILSTVADDSQQLKIFFRIFQIPEHTIIKDLFTGQITGQLHGIQKISSTASAECLSFVLTMLMSVRSPRNLDIISSEEYRDSDLDSNIICIGCPLANEVTRRILESQRSWTPYKFEEGKIRKTDGTQEWTITEEVDHGIIIKTKNPFFANKWVFIFAGLSGDASVGASFFFQSKFKKLVAQFKDEPFGVVINVDRRTGYMSSRQIDCATRG